MRSQASTCTYGVPSHQGGFLFQRPRNAARQEMFSRARAPPVSASAKRKLRDDDNSNDADQFFRRPDGHFPSFAATTRPTAGRVVVDEYGNRILVEGVKRMRVSSPPTVPNGARKSEDIAMDDTDSDSDAIVPVQRQAGARTARLVGPAKRAVAQYASIPTLNTDADPSCRAMVVFDPHQALVVERSPRIQLVSDSDAERATDSEDEAGKEPFVRFEELPDDYGDEPEAMELD